MKTRIITAIVGIIVLIGVMFTFNTLIFNLVIAAITLIAIHEIYNALGFTKKDWLMYAALVPYTLLVMTSNYMVMRRLVMPVSGLKVVSLVPESSPRLAAKRMLSAAQWL